MGVDYFPELRDYVNKNRDKYGISNLSLVKDKNVLGGVSWKYTYYDMTEDKLRVISSYDIKKLRRSVEAKGLKWVVTNVERARETYKLNSRLLVEHERIREANRERVAEYTVSKSGVQYVYLNNTGNNKGNSYWTYRDNKHPSITRKTLTELKSVVEELGYEWIVKDMELYMSILEQEQRIRD